MEKAEFWACIVLNVIIFAILNIWLLWFWALMISVAVIWGGFIVIDSDASMFD
jgi:type IV secretory pathway VirB3-like protein